MTFIGCSKDGDKRLEEKADIDTNAQLKAEEARSKQMLKDLKKQKRFYDALYGEFEGELSTGAQKFKLRITFVPKLPIYISDERVLTVSEVEDYLINQSFNIHLLSWDASNNLTASGCQVEGVKPDLNEGMVYVSSEACSNLYLIAIDNMELNDQVDIESRFQTALNGLSKSIAEIILSEDDYIVNDLVGEMRPTTNASVYSFKLKRVR